MLLFSLILAEFIILSLVTLMIINRFKIPKKDKNLIFLQEPLKKTPVPMKINFVINKTPKMSTKSRDLIPFGLTDEELEIHRMFYDED